MSNIPYFLSLEVAQEAIKDTFASLLLLTDNKLYDYPYYRHTKANKLTDLIEDNHRTAKAVDRFCSNCKPVKDIVTSSLMVIYQEPHSCPMTVVIHAIIDIRTTKTITPQVEELLAIAGYKTRIAGLRNKYRIYEMLAAQTMYVDKENTLTHYQP